jgi:hypothetical protein
LFCTEDTSAKPSNQIAKTAKYKLYANLKKKSYENPTHSLKKMVCRFKAQINHFHTFSHHQYTTCFFCQNPNFRLCKPNDNPNSPHVFITNLPLKRRKSL